MVTASSALAFVAFAVASCHATVNLPGVDVLSAGYDAAAWTSKAAIFDFSKDGQTVEVSSIGKTYTAPEMVTVVTDGMNLARVEDSCSGVATSFSDYLHIHQRSTKFDVGVDLGAYSLGLSVNRDVDEVYKSITAKGQAVGVSESWWGMYEATAPPAFLLESKLSPVFAASKNALKAIGAPKTEAHQSIYNQVCCGPAGFGTHYVGSVIVGGRATVTTFVNSSFHSEYDHKTVSQQASIGFEHNKLKLSLSDDAKDVRNKMMQDFQNNSHTRVTYQPNSPGILTADAPWKEWELKAVESPSVVNTSVSSIANLFFDAPEVMTHMQKTIDFYVKNARAPTLAEAQALKSSVGRPNPMVPGTRVVGCGFDATGLTSKACLFDVPADDIMEWSNPYYPDIKYSVPMGYYAMDTPESTLLNATIRMESIDDYVEHSVWTEEHHHHGFAGFGSKKESKTTDRFYRMFYGHTYSLALSLKQIAWYSLSLMEFPLPTFTKPFQMSLDYLPSVYDAANPVFKMFFQSFGTSVVTKADMGGLVWAETWFESCLERQMTDVCIDDEVSRGWWVAHHHTSDHQCDEHMTEGFQKMSEWHYEMLGGTDKVNISEWEQWALTVKHDPRPVKMTVVPIHYLLPDNHPKKAVLIEATNDFLLKAESDKQAKIEAMLKVRPPPDSNCTKYEVAALTGGPAESLCPIVGYHGAFCPSSGVSRPHLGPLMTGETPLPKGVGLTIDVSTGELKLPAWNFDTAGSTGTWTDPGTGEKFLLPKGLSLNSGGVAGENVPQTHVFKSASELANVWEQGYKAGNWLGGEFGHSKSVLDLFTKFFSKQQSTAINQHPAALYRLTLNGAWEKNLNVFAQAALKALPQAYDANLYNRFMDTWGTHVARDTLVGGMQEQQVVMKDCMWQSPYLTGGLTPEKLEEYLKLDMKKAPPQDSFYLDRRQMSIDHRIGGNPEIGDLTGWQKSLGKNPALIKIYSHVKWSDVASKSGLVSAAVVNNLNKAITDRMTQRENERAKENTEAAKKETEELQGPRSVVAVVAHGRRGSIAPSMETGKYLTMAGFSQCPAGLPVPQSKQKCNTGVYIQSWNSHHLNEPLRYERNAQGDMSSIRCYDLDGAGNCKQHSGPFVRNGCSLMPKADGSPRPLGEKVPDSTVVAMVCADCEVMSATFASDATLKCVCPGYSKKLTDTDNRIKSKGLVDFKQCDPRWKCHPYAGHSNLTSTCSVSNCTQGQMSNNICISGCGVA